MKSCELCNGVARMYCESDNASLCWDCDEKVHCANFLVAKHSRSLLCQTCQAPTTWRASGPKLGPTVSICESCFSSHQRRRSDSGCDPEESHMGNCPSCDDCSDESSDDEDEEEYDDEDDEEEEEEGEEEGENQVVPWSVTPATPPVTSSSSSEDVWSGFSRGNSVLKRMRGNSSDLDTDDEGVCSSYRTGHGKSSSDEGDLRCSSRLLKRGEVEGDEEHDNGLNHRQSNPEFQEESRSTARFHSSKRLRTEMIINKENASQSLLELCRMSKRRSSIN